MTVPGGNPLFVWIHDAARRLEAIGAGNPRLEAEYLMAAALGIPRIRLWLIDRSPTPDELTGFDVLLARRLAREPLQYVLGTAEFAGLELAVGPGVLIPRSETEVLVELVERELAAGCGSLDPAPAIVDVGTGSGAILLALLRRLRGARGVGIDSQPAALAWARRNAERLARTDLERFSDLSRRVRFLEGDLLQPVEGETRFDAIVSNPPYVRLGERRDLAPEVRDHEPPVALFAGEDGLDVFRRLIPQAAEHLRPGGLLALEIGIAQSRAVLDLLGEGSWRGAEVRPDLTGRPRVVLARRA